MRHLNLELEKLEKRIAPGLALPMPMWGTSDCGCGTGGSNHSGGSKSNASGGSKSNASGGSKSHGSGGSKASGGSKSGGSK